MSAIYDAIQAALGKKNSDVANGAGVDTLAADQAAIVSLQGQEAVDVSPYSGGSAGEGQNTAFASGSTPNGVSSAG